MQTTLRAGARKIGTAVRKVTASTNAGYAVGAAAAAAALGGAVLADSHAAKGGLTPVPAGAPKYLMGPLPVVSLEEVQKHTTREASRGAAGACRAPAAAAAAARRGARAGVMGAD